MSDKQIRVRATAMGFLGQLLEKGSVFLIPDEAAFAPSWMERLDGGDASPLATDVDPAFIAVHNGGGNWIVVKVEDDSRASRRFLKSEGNAKGLAEAEAIRLNAGGELILDALPTTPPAGPTSETDSSTDPNLPDA